MSSCLVGVSVVKNEADIIEANIRHNLLYLDRMIVFDHDSGDATPRILQALVEEGLAVTLIRLGQSEPGFRQAQFTTTLARGAFENWGADYVFPLDADEFLRVPTRAALESALHAAGGSVSALCWQTFAPSEQDQHEHPLRSLRWRIDTNAKALSKIVIPRQILQKNWFIGRGNHVVYDQDGNNVNWTAGEPLVDMTLAHLPLRSCDQATTKVLVGWLSRKLSYGPKSATTSNSWHFREMFRRIVGGQPLTPADVRNMAVDFYALGKPAAGDSKQVFAFVEDPIGEAMPLRYTPEHPVDAAVSLALWGERLVDTLTQSPVEQATAAAVPAGS